MGRLLLKYAAAVWGAGFVLISWALEKNNVALPEWLIWSAFFVGSALLLIAACSWLRQEWIRCADARTPKRLPFLIWREKAESAGWDFSKADVLPLLDSLREAAANGDLALWGRNGSSQFSELTAREPLLPIPAEHWTKFQVSPIELMNATVNTDVISYTLSHEIGWVDLHIDGPASLRWLVRETKTRKPKQA
jgi:hypothetical protein